MTLCIIQHLSEGFIQLTLFFVQLLTHITALFAQSIGKRAVVRVNHWTKKSANPISPLAQVFAERGVIYILTSSATAFEKECHL